MAVSTVSSTTVDNWQLISTTTPTSTSSISITVPSGFKTLMLTWSNISFATNISFLVMQFNSDTASNYVGTSIRQDAYAAFTSKIPLGGSNEYTGQPMDGNIVIKDASNTTVPKLISGVGGQASTQINVITGAYNSTNAITSIQLKGSSSGVFTASAGSIVLYGIAA